MEPEVFISSRLPSGSSLIDDLIGGGYEQEIITTIYGNAGAGKTTLVLLAAKSAIEQDMRVVLVDTESGFSIERFMQIVGGDATKALSRLVVIKPQHFEDQKQKLQYLAEHMREEVGLIIIDSVSMLYKLELSDTRSIPEKSRLLASHISVLMDLAVRYKIPVLVTSQVYSSVDSEKTNLYGGNFIQYASKCLIELIYDPQNGSRTVVLRKHRSIREGGARRFSIVDEGLIPEERLSRSPDDLRV